MIEEAAAPEEAGAPGSSPAGGGTVRQLLDLALQRADGSDATPERAAAWARLEQAFARREPLRGRIMLSVGPGAFMDLGAGLYGFAPRLELPDWVARQPRADQVGRSLEAVVIALDEEAGSALLSPRLLSLRRARDALDQDRGIRGTVISATLSGQVVDIDGARGFVSLDELPPERLLNPPKLGSPWHGYVAGVSDIGPLLSYYAPHVRALRTIERQAALARLQPGSVERATVIGARRSSALVSFDEGLAWGAVVRAAFASPGGRRLAPGVAASFRVLGRCPGSQPQLQLWPAATQPAPQGSSVSGAG
jgi:hypothetical protein